MVKKITIPKEVRPLILASTSDWRVKLLKILGVPEFKVLASDYEEDMQAKEDPYELAQYLAWGKARAVAEKHQLKNEIVIGADTFVHFKNQFIGKAKNEAEARQMIEDFSGQTHTIMTGLAVLDTGKRVMEGAAKAPLASAKKPLNSIKISNTQWGRLYQTFDQAQVTFRPLSEAEIDDYIATADWQGKAGAYGQMSKASGLIEKTEGDFFSITGLPLSKLFLVLRIMGQPVWLKGK
jgi:septum formation protein